MLNKLTPAIWALEAALLARETDEQNSCPNVVFVPITDPPNFPTYLPDVPCDAFHI
jgi:hypothetical protein